MKAIQFRQEELGLSGLLIMLCFALILSTIVYWRYKTISSILIVFIVVAIFCQFRSWSNKAEKRLVDAALEGKSLLGYLSDDVHQSEPVWRIDFPAGMNALYLSWNTRKGLRTGIAEPTHVSWFLGDKNPIGKNLATRHPVNVFTTADTATYLVEADESYFVCKTSWSS
jgi:hypothetical protein